MSKKSDGSGLAKGLTNYGDNEFSLFLRKAFASAAGHSPEMLEKPVIGIAQAPSGFNPCHRTFPELVEAIKRGVIAEGGMPFDFPTISLGESFTSPTTMKYRNLLSMDVEEMIGAQPMDSVVLLGGCDKNVPAQMMGAFSADIPAIQLVPGPMLPMPFEGERLGACTDCRRYWGNYRGGKITEEKINLIGTKLAATAGTCAVMGTASTMASIVEVLGMSLPNTAAIPAVHSDRIRAAEETGRQAVRLAKIPILPSQIVTPQAIENALVLLLAIGGSTNAIIHLTAMAGRLGLKVSMETLNELSEKTPVLVNLKPTGEHYMSDLYAAGGIPAVLRELKPLLHLDCLTVTGKTLGQHLEEASTWVDRTVVRTMDEPYQEKGGLIALFGSLAPSGAILKRSAADPALMEKEGRAVVFNSLQDLAQRIDSPDLDVKADDILVLQNAGPRSESGMPEAGCLPIPKKLSSQGVRDMLRISDARMSGTAFGSVVLHVSPEAAVGGPLGLVRTGDRIRMSAKDRKLDLLVDSAELEQRRSEATSEQYSPKRGYSRLYAQSTLQADAGCDFDFLTFDGGDTQ